MNDGIKQRIVGALVLLALLVIFLPVLFDRNRVEPVDTTSQVPPAPKVEALDIPVATPPAVAESEVAPVPETMLVPDEKQAMKPEQVRSEMAKTEAARLAAHPVKTPPTPDKPAAAADKPAAKSLQAHAQALQARSQAAVEPPSPAAKAALEPPKLTAKGVPASWVLQVASYRSPEQAKTLRDALNARGFSAYSRELTTAKGPVVRVYVGPKVDKASLLETKKRLDEAFKLNALVLPYTPGT
jgi:DedD protein